jgi:outer membrane immunogenic protein
MKALTLAVAGILGSMHPVLAGGPTAVAADPVPVADAAPVAMHDWSGAYVGLSYGRSASSQATDTTLGPVYDFTSGSVAGVHLGYLFQSGNLVYGAELAHLTYNDVNFEAFPTYSMDSTTDLKGRLGYAWNRLEVHGILGYSTGKFSLEVPGISATYKPKGTSYGLGVDFAATQNLSIGLEYLARKMSADGPLPGSSDVDFDINTLSLRVGLSF